MTTNVIVPLVDYIEDGVTTVHPIPYKFLSDGDLVVTRTIGDLAPVTLTLGVDYTAIGAGDAAGGSLVKADGGTIGALLVIGRRSIRSQGVDFTPNDTFPAESNETALDRLSLIDQEQDVELDRALKVRPGSVGLDVGAIAEGQVLALISGALIGVDNDATGAAGSAAAAAAERVLAELARQGAETAEEGAAEEREGAEAASTAAIFAALSGQSFFPAARDYVPQGAVTGPAAITAAGTGGADGTFALAWTGGNFGVNPGGTFTVAGGVVTAITIAGPGLYIGAAISAPAFSFAASTGLTGAAATLATHYLKTEGELWLTDHLTDANQASLFQNQANAAVELVASVGWLNISAAVAAAAVYDDLIASLSTTTLQYIGRPLATPPGSGNATLGNQYYTFKDPVTLPGQLALSFPGLAAGSAKVGLFKADLSLRVAKTFAIAGAGAQSLTDATLQAETGDFVSIIASAGVLPTTTSSSVDGLGYWSGGTSGGNFPATLVQTGGSSTTRIEASGIITNIEQTVTATALEAFEENVADLDVSVTGMERNFEDVYEIFGPATLGDPSNAATSAHTYISKSQCTRFEQLDVLDLHMHAAGNIKFKAYSADHTSGFVAELIGSSIPLIAGAHSLTPAALGFADFEFEPGMSWAIYSNGTIAFQSSVASSGFWQLNGDDLDGGTTTTASSGTIMARPRFKASQISGKAGAQAFDYDAATGSALLKNTAIVGAGGVDLLIIGLGQSLGGGYNTDAGDPAITTAAEHAGYGFMPNAGVIPAGAAITSYVDLVEATGAASHETPAAGCVSAILERLNTRHGRKPRLIYAIAFKAGQAYAGGTSTVGSDVKRGSTTYEEAMRIARECVVLSASQDRKLIVLAATVAHGEQDFNDGLGLDLYQRALDQYQSNFEEDIRRITGQTAPVPFYVYQSCRAGSTVGAPSGPALAQIAAPKRNPKIRSVGPIYYCPQATDGAHIKSRGYRWVGRQFGTYIAEDLFGPYLEPLRAVSDYWSAGNKFCLEFNKPIAIEADDSKVVISTLGAGKGVDFDDGSADAITASKAGTTLTVTAIVGAINIGDRLVSSGGVAVIISGFLTGAGGIGTYTVDISGTVISTTWTLRRAPVALAIKAGTTNTIEVTLSGTPTGLRPRAWIAARGAGSGNISGPRSAIRSSVAFDTDPNDGSVLYDWACQEEIVL